jgi:hypothetical protein
MFLLKYSISFLLLFPSLGHSNFTLSDCLNSEYKTEVSHKVKPFGLLDVKLSLRKSKCNISIEHKKIFTKKWAIDVCRAPVHIKSGKNGVDVLKRINCFGVEKSGEYCTELNGILETIQNDGLIFAEGEKEQIATDHGKVFCVFTLLEQYLKQGIVLSRFQPQKLERFVSEPLLPKESQNNYAPTENPSHSDESGSDGEQADF